MKEIIKIKDLTKSYDGKTVVDSVSLEVKKGEIFGFLGLNGAGKTTTIKSMLRMINPDRGEVRVFGKTMKKEHDKILSKIGYLPENIQLYNNLTGLETLKFYADIKGVEIDDGKQLLNRVGLTQAIHQKVGKYSKGMKQRLAIGQAFLGDPPLIILDEPIGGLDPRGASAVKDMVREHSENGGTVFLSSHILPNVEYVADRVGIIKDGKLLTIGRIEELREKIGSTTKLTLELSSVDEELKNLLDQDKKVTDYSIMGNEIVIKCRKEHKRKIMNQIEDKGLKILDFGVEEKNLEEIFLDMTED